MNFETVPPGFEKYFSPFVFNRTNLVISDSIGNVIFYSNGCQIADASHGIMENGDSINQGLQWQEDGYLLPFSSFSVPDLSNEGIYYLFYTNVDTTSIYTFNYANENILYSIIDLNLNNGFGAVISKDDTLVSGLFLGFPSAVKHANGRDWWIVTPDWIESRYNIHLLNSFGISATSVQEIGYKPPNERDQYGNKLFTPDGNKYLDYDFQNGIRLFDFDRCTGILSNPQNCIVQPGHFGAAAFSPNSRFLYTTQGYYIFQYDLEADDLCASVDTLAILDSIGWVLGPFLAPDGKIYINVDQDFLPDPPTMHIIHQPDLKGDLSQFELNALFLPCDNIQNLPIFPNYRLYDIPGSPCDTLGIDDPNVATHDVPEKRIAVFPNPASEMIYADISGLQANELHYTLSDITGKVIRTAAAPVFQEKISISCAGLADGVYFLSLYEEGSLVVTEKVVVLKDR